MDLSQYIANCYTALPLLREYENPWDVTNSLAAIIRDTIQQLSTAEFHISNTIAIHKNAVVESTVTIKEYTIIEDGAIVKAGAYLRDGVYLGRGVSVGANCEIKQSLIFNISRIAHLNYVGNSIIGRDVNIEAGAVLANHFNERENKEIEVLINGKRVTTKATKFGSLLADGCRIGANAVLNPGTVLQKNTVVDRLTHLDQLKHLV